MTHFLWSLLISDITTYVAGGLVTLIWRGIFFGMVWAKEIYIE